MMRFFLMVAAFVWVAAFSGLSAQEKEDPLTTAYHTLAEKKDHAGLVELWKKNASSVLYTIDADLEGSLALLEKSRANPDQKTIDAMRARALFGAAAADEAFGTNIFSDYAASFASQDEAAQKRFRAGQKAHGEAGQALRKKDFAAAKTAAETCVDLTKNLGDWWGWAMGLASLGAAQEGLGDFDAAITAHALARRIYHDLHLLDAELQNAVAMSRLLVKAERFGRARASIADAMRLAKARNATKAVETLEKLLPAESPASAPAK